MPVIISRFHSFNRYISQIENLVFAIYNSFTVSNDLTVRVAVFYLINSAVVIVTVSYENQVCREIIAVTGIGVNVDHLALAGNDAQAGLALVEQGGSGRWFRRGSHRAF